nr:sigma factor-like helix-turn-helix DNA-binding protein [Coralloluteibacterium stylophorae]
MADWPLAFWSRLIAQPELRGAPLAAPDPAVAALAAITPGPRAALLLRLVAGLPLHEGARAMGVSEKAYRHALARALQDLRSAASGDAEGELQALRDALQARVRDLPQDVRDHLARVREAVARERPLPAPAPEPAPAPRRERDAAPRPGMRLALWLALAAVAAAFAWTFVPPAVPPLPPGAMQALPAETPVRTLTPEAELLADPDFEMHADPDGARLAQRLDFFSWYAAEGAVAADPAPEDDDAP